MALESATYISDLNASNPTSGDSRNQGDDHIRMIKSAIKNTFPSLNDAVTVTATELNRLSGITSGVQAQLLDKAAKGANIDITSLNSPAIGSATATTQSTSDDSTKVATTEFVQNMADLLCPPGTILPFSSNTVPSGFLEIPTIATTKLRADYPRLHALYAADGYPWGNGDGSTTFGIPYLKSDYTWLQAGAGATGTETIGEVIAHTHTTTTTKIAGNIGSGPGPYFDTGNTGSTGGPFNKAAGARVKFMVKY